MLQTAQHRLKQGVNDDLCQSTSATSHNQTIDVHTLLNDPLVLASAQQLGMDQGSQSFGHS